MKEEGKESESERAGRERERERSRKRERERERGEERYPLGVKRDTLEELGVPRQAAPTLGQRSRPSGSRGTCAGASDIWQVKYSCFMVTL